MEEIHNVTNGSVGVIIYKICLKGGKKAVPKLTPLLVLLVLLLGL
jgi:hypothetical protein